MRFSQIISVILVAVFVSACATSGEGPWERSGQRNGGAIGLGVGAAAGVIGGALLGGKGGAVLGGLAGGVIGSALGSGIGGAIRSAEDPKYLCDANGEDQYGDPCMHDTDPPVVQIERPTTYNRGYVYYPRVYRTYRTYYPHYQSHHHNYNHNHNNRKHHR